MVTSALWTVGAVTHRSPWAIWQCKARNLCIFIHQYMSSLQSNGPVSSVDNLLRASSRHSLAVAMPCSPYVAHQDVSVLFWNGSLQREMTSLASVFVLLPPLVLEIKGCNRAGKGVGVLKHSREAKRLLLFLSWYWKRKASIFIYFAQFSVMWKNIIKSFWNHKRHL